MTKYLTIDRILGLVFTAFWAFLAWGAVKSLSGHMGWGPWLLSLIWVIALALWASKGLKDIEIGHRGQLLFLGQRMNYFFKVEGKHWAPFPFGIKPADCREQIMRLDSLEAITKDNVKVFVDVTLTYNIFDLHKNSNVQDGGINKGIDDARDQILRVQIASSDLDDVLKMHAELGQKMHAGLQDSSKRWGIEIIEVMITKVVTNPKVAEDLELKAREELQRKGQMTEAEGQATLVAFFMKPNTATGFPGLTREQAVEQAQLTIGQAKKNINGITLDSTTAAAIAAILAGRK